MKKNVFYSIALVALLFSSCATPNVSYFNDMNHGQIEEAVRELDILLLPDDKISIVVKSKDALLSDLFNLPIVSHRVGYTQASSMNSSQSMSVYTVDRNGDIDFPVLGKIHAAGMRRDKRAVHVDRCFVRSAFEGQGHALSLPFRRRGKAPAVAAEHLVDAFVEVVEGGLLHRVRQAHGLKTGVVKIGLHHVFFKAFVEYPTVVERDSLADHSVFHLSSEKSIP